VIGYVVNDINKPMVYLNIRKGWRSNTERKRTTAPYLYGPAGYGESPIAAKPGETLHYSRSYRDNANGTFMKKVNERMVM